MVPVIGVGASAGGLEAYTQLLTHLRVDTGMGFVLVQHLDPNHESALTSLLARSTAMPVHEVKDNLRVVANHVYVIPPNASLSIVAGVLKLSARGRNRSAHRPIDSFFESLAQDQRERAIGIVLSGTATDGTLGLEAIKAEGGITFAQDGSAKYDSMPRSAIATGVVDYVLSPANIAEELARIAKHPYLASINGKFASTLDSESERESDQEDSPHAPLASGGHGTPPTGSEKARAEVAAASDPSGPEEEGFKRILLLLRKHCGVDFSLYKSSTIRRRIARRMVLGRQDTFEQYAASLKGNAPELDALYSDVLISVTSFFRNPESFDVLQQKVFPELLKQRRGRDEPVRAWTLGCSTGQEAYSIAIAFAEFTDKIDRAPKLQIFATDLNEALLDKARHGLYSKTLAQDVSAARLRRFFVEEEGGFRINKALREQVVFARQNVLSDPPFSRMDLISCRNLLIYLEAGLQRRIMPAFHYALRPGGFLFLGASESIGPFTDLFAPVDKKHRIFSKKAAPTPQFRMPLPSGRASDRAAGPLLVARAPVDLPENMRGEFDAQREANRIMVNQFAPPGVLVNADLQVLKFNGPTSEFLQPPTGKASFNVLKMAREGLMLPLRAAINKATRENKPVVRENVRVPQNGGPPRSINIQVIPLKNLKERWYLILFESSEARSARPAPGTPPARPLTKREESRRVAEAEREVAETRDYLQSIQEQNEAVNEELQASNEEVQSANEELQSINEELETSKEELESSNEELTTVNEEMANRNTELARLNADLNNLQLSMQTAIVVLGRDLTIRRFTPPAERIFNLLPTDVGRSLGGVRHNLKFNDLERLLGEVIDAVRPRDREVQDQEGRWYALRARPYLTLDNKVDGVVLMLMDVDELKRSELETRRARDFAEATLRTAPVPLVVLRPDLRVDMASEAFYQTFRVSPSATEGRLIYELGNGQWNIPKLRELLEDVLPQNSSFKEFEVTHAFDTLGRRHMLLNARRMATEEGRPLRIVLVIEDDTERLAAQADLRASERRFRRLFEAAHDGVLLIDPVSRQITDVNPYMLNLLGYTREELIGQGLYEAGLIQAEEVGRRFYEALETNQSIRYEDLPLKTKAGGELEVEVVANIYAEDGHEVIQCNVRDISERKAQEAAMRRANERFRFLAEAMPQKIFTATAGGEVDYFNRRWMEFTGLSFDQIKGWGWTQFVHPDDLDENVRRWKRALDTGEPFELEHRFRRHDGVYRWHLSRAHIMLSGEGDNARWVGSSTDIDDVKKAEERLRATESRFRRLFESVPAAVFACDSNGVIQDYNRRAQEYWGRAPVRGDPAERYSGSFKQSLPDGTPLANERTVVADVLRDGIPRENVEVLIERPDRSRLPVIVSCFPLTSGAGEIIGAITCFSDITQVKRFEREREALLANEQASRMEAEAANRSKDIFLATLSHEMRTPLNAIVGWMSILQSKDRTEEDVQEGLKIIDRNTKAQVQLIEDVLDVSRIVSGKLRLEIKPCDLSATINGALDTVRAAAAAKEIQLTADLDPIASAAYCDSARMQQVVWNLLSNAIKFTPKGGTVRATLARAHSTTCITVSDTGSGIKPEFLPYVFDRFRQADGSSRRKVGGLGLGLSIVKHLMELHGGSVSAASEGEGHGATFIVQLPIRAVRVDEIGEKDERRIGVDGTAQDAAGSMPSEFGLSAHTSTIRLDGLNVLAVDDEADARRLLAKVLEQAGANVTTADSAAGALRQLFTKKPDVLVSDLGMPEMDGLDLIRQVRAQGHTKKDLPAVALTAFAHKDDARRALLAGFQVHVPKPVDPHDLIAVIASLAGHTD
jgi:two-component system CheB/CheR fusion protein